MAQTITPCLWFNGQAEEATNFYLSVFPNSEVLNVTRYTEVGPGEPGPSSRSPSGSTARSTLP